VYIYIYMCVWWARGQGTGDILTHSDSFLQILTQFYTFACPKFQGEWLGVWGGGGGGGYMGGG
jgi:hypothetical protein